MWKQILLALNSTWRPFCLVELAPTLQYQPLSSTEPAATAFFPVACGTAANIPQVFGTAAPNP